MQGSPGDAPYERLAVAPLAGALGAEIGGVDVTAADDTTWAEIHRAFGAYAVLVFRDQVMDAHALAAFAEHFGPLTRTAYVGPGRDHPMVTDLIREADVPSSERNVGDNWHADQSPRERPTLGFAMYCREAPPVGGDTLFASLSLAYERLSDGMKALCDRLIVMHSASGKFGRDGTGAGGGVKALSGGAGAKVEFDAATLESFARETEHPLVIEHPETGRRALWVTGAYAVRFKDMTREESRPLLDYLNAHAVRPEFTCRVRWRPGTLLFMDNRCTQHYALNDYAGYRRHMLRVEVEAEPPFGPARPRIPG